ncbi:MAG: HD-GYP domain-containing protein [Deltaproteobacteria bacterium]|nr:HD-GYP domain-containing protein [Deltaproteobacteria bacterium]MBW2415743.1 HD-GYP domain-containing protein [Deltaproteobacteria bacterium]
MAKPRRQHRPRRGLALGPDEPLEERIRARVEPRFEIRVDAESPARDDVELRIVGPRELEHAGSDALRRHRLRAAVTPLLVIVPPHATVSAVRDCFRSGAGDVIGYEELDESLLPTLERLIGDARAAAPSSADGADAVELAASARRRASELERALHQVREGYDETLAALVRSLDVRERETASHSHRVAIYSVRLGLREELGEDELETLYRGALLHDIGKIGIPDAVLLKPGELCDEEWKVMRTHAALGADLVRSIGFLREASDVPLSHHEAWDGSGYPSGLAGTEIPLHARIFAIADSYDAIRSARAYKSARSHEQALEQLLGDAGARLDPELVAHFVSEPLETWKELESVASGASLTFEAALEACRALPDADLPEPVEGE